MEKNPGSMWLKIWILFAWMYYSYFVYLYIEINYPTVCYDGPLYGTIVEFSMLSIKQCRVSGEDNGQFWCRTTSSSSIIYEVIMSVSVVIPFFFSWFTEIFTIDKNFMTQYYIPTGF